MKTDTEIRVDGRKGILALLQRPVGSFEKGDFCLLQPSPHPKDYEGKGITQEDLLWQIDTIERGN